jgi:hypothetical protein
MTDEDDVTRDPVDPNAGDRFYQNFNPHTLAYPLARTVANVADEATNTQLGMVRVLGSKSLIETTSSIDMNLGDILALVERQQGAEVDVISSILVEDNMASLLRAMAQFNRMTSKVRSMREMVPGLQAMVMNQHMLAQFQDVNLMRRIWLGMARLNKGGLNNVDINLEAMMNGGLRSLTLTTGITIMMLLKVLDDMNNARASLAEQNKRLGGKADSMDFLAKAYAEAEAAKKGLVETLNIETAKMVNYTIQGPDVDTRVDKMVDLANQIRETNKLMSEHGKHVMNALDALLLARTIAGGLGSEMTEHFRTLQAYGNSAQLADLLSNLVQICMGGIFSVSSAVSAAHQHATIRLLSGQVDDLSDSINYMSETVIASIQDAARKAGESSPALVVSDGKLWRLSPDGTQYLPVDEAGGE